MVTEAIDANPKSVEDFKNGKQKAVGSLSWSSHESNKRTSKSANG